jgi:hypothetical protein
VGIGEIDDGEEVAVEGVGEGAQGSWWAREGKRSGPGMDLLKGVVVKR